MRVRVVLLDVYGTLLEVRPVAETAERERRWQAWRARYARAGGPATHEEYLASVQQGIAQHQDAARRRGVQSPEVCWPAVVAEIFPGMSGWDGSLRAQAEADLMTVTRSLRLMPGCEELLRRWHRMGLRLGILSNAQAYSVSELDAALSGSGLSLALFDPRLVFWSFEHGFSKPNPHAFQILAARLAAGGYAAPEILMVGDREDNDMVPARAFGWRTWHLGRAGDGDWAALTAWFDHHTPEA